MIAPVRGRADGIGRAATAFAVGVHELGVGSAEALALVTQALEQQSLS
ncbi:MAG: hypothetical protein R6W83_00815 [Cryobacterium sp.]